MAKSKGKKCKCCNTIIQGKYHLVYDAAGKERNIEFMLYDYIGKQLSEADGDHQAICDTCLTQLIQCYEFKQKCIQANEINDESSSSSFELNDKSDINLDIKLEPQDISIVEDAQYYNHLDDTQFEEIFVVEGGNGNGNEQSDDIGEFEQYAEYSEDQYEAIESNEDSSGYLNNCYGDYSNFIEVIEEAVAEPDDVDGETDSITMTVDYLDEMLNEQLDDVVEEKKPTLHMWTSYESFLNYKFTQLLANADEFTKIKQKLRHGIPRHIVELKSVGMSMSQHGGYAQNFDVDKIVTSDDLINILEDDYQSENSYAKRVRDDVDVFEIPKNEACEEVEYLEEEEHVNIDDYLKSIISATYVEVYNKEIFCELCSEKLATHHQLMHHISQTHRTGNMCMCIFDRQCPLFDGAIKAQEHVLNEHSERLPMKICLLCPSCDTSFESSVLFGKHICHTVQEVYESSDDFQCDECDRRLNSRKRFLFHKQFHLRNARPKICIICELTFQDEEKFYNHVTFSHEQIFEYFCDQCDKSFSSKFQLERHMKLHYTIRNFHCTICDKSFFDKQTLEDHVISKHSADKIHVCRVCDKMFKRASRLRKHMTTHEVVEKNTVLTCSQCALVFASETKADEHCHRWHDDDGASIEERELMSVVCCEFCELAFYDYLSLVKHKQVHRNDDKPFRCEFCMARYETYSKLKTHKNSHINQQAKFPVQRNYMCDSVDCWKKYRHWSDLLNHRKTVHLINPSIIKCNECGKTFYQSWKYDYHKKTSHAQPVQCEDCANYFTSVFSLKLHRRKHHSGTISANKVKTKESNKLTFTFDTYMYKNSNNQLICRECGKLFSTRNNARSHIEMVHLKIKNYTCATCTKQFYLKKDFDDHTRLHTAELPFKCHLCGKHCRTTSILNEHKKYHTNERPYQCPYCASAFKRGYVLKNHIKQHIGIREFRCPIPNCGKEYRTQWELNYHSRQKHSNKNSVCPPSNGNDAVNEQFAQMVETNTSKPILLEQKPKIKRSNRQNITRTTGESKKQAAGKPKIIYVLPGPVPLTKQQLQQSEGGQQETEADHNYPAKKRHFDAEASINPKFVYIVANHDNDAQGHSTINRLIVDNVTDSTEMDIGACQVIGEEPLSIIL